MSGINVRRDFCSREGMFSQCRRMPRQWGGEEDQKAVHLCEGKWKGGWEQSRVKVPSLDQRPLLTLMPDTSIFSYISNWINRFLKVHTEVGDLLHGSFGGFGWLIMLFFP